MSRRATIAGRRRAERRLALAEAEREWVIGGPPVDGFEPIIGGDLGPEHVALVENQLHERAVRVAVEIDKLAVYFAHRCCAVKAVRDGMLADFRSLSQAAGEPHFAPRYSTTTVPTTTTIPRLQ